MLKDLDRIIITVKNLDESIIFFEDLLDIKFDVIGGSRKLQIRGAYSACKLELIEPYGDGSFLSSYLEKNGEGIAGIVVKVNDIEASGKILEEKGLRKTMDFRAGNMRQIAFNAEDSHGVQIVLAEYPEKHPATAASWAVECPLRQN